MSSSKMSRLISSSSGFSRAADYQLAVQGLSASHALLAIRWHQAGYRRRSRRMGSDIRADEASVANLRWSRAVGGRFHGVPCLIRRGVEQIRVGGNMIGARLGRRPRPAEIRRQRHAGHCAQVISMSLAARRRFFMSTVATIRELATAV